MEMMIIGVIFFVIVLIVRRKEAFELRWKPDRGTWVAVGTGLLVFVLSLSLLLLPEGSVLRAFIHYGLIYVLCGAIIPWGYTLLVEGQSVQALGVTRQRWLPSLIISLVLTALFSLLLVFEAQWEGVSAGLVVRAEFVLLVGTLFELLLYNGFIHLRLERAFGVIPAILLTSAIYVLWHAGTQLPLEADLGGAVLKLFFVGVMYQSVFSLTRNLLIIWPLFAGVGVLIDFAVNVGELGIAAAYLPWGIGSLAAMVVMMVVIVRRDRSLHSG